MNKAASRRSSSSFGGFLRAVGAIAWKDLAAELRSRELLSAMLVFALLVILIFNFALELDVKTRATITAGVLWVTFAFAGTLGLNRSMAVEKDRGCLDGLLLAPVDRSAIYFGKVISNLAFMLIVEAIVLPVYSILYNINLFDPGLLRRDPARFHRLRGGRDAALQHGSADPHPRCAAAHPALPGHRARPGGGGQSQQRIPAGTAHGRDPALAQPAGRL